MSGDDDREFDALVEELTGQPTVQPRSPAPPAAAPPVQPPPPATGPPRRGLLERLLDLRVAGILGARYVDLKLADLGGTALVVAQAALIGLFVGLAYEGQGEGLGLQFVLAMVAVWLGTFNSCREVVKERLIFLRERRAGVSIRAYLVSKLGVLAFLAAAQCLLLVAIVARSVRFTASLPLVYLVLLLTTLSATGLGLLLSSLVDNQNKLIALVPVALIPQLIFSDLLLPNPSLAVERIQLLMLADWSLEALRQLARTSPDWLQIIGSMVVLLVMGVGCLLLAGFGLGAQEE